MADETNPTEQPGSGADLGLRTEMAVSELVLRHGAKIAGVVVLVIVGIAVYGLWRQAHTEAQREITASIADVEAELGTDMLQLAQERAFGGGEVDEAKLRTAADGLLTIARESSGTAAVEAALKAAEVYRLAGDATQRRAALDVAAAGADGVLRFAAVTGLAQLDLEEGKADEALSRLRSLQTETPFVARQATLEIASALEALDRDAEAAATYDDYLKRWPEAPDAEEVAERRQKVADTQG